MFANKGLLLHRNNYKIILYKLLVLDRNTCNYTTGCKLFVLDRNTWNYTIEWKLFVLDKNTWNYTNVWKLFVLDRNTWNQGQWPRGVMVKAMDCGIVVSEFVLQSLYNVHFRANALGKGMNPPYPPSYGLIKLYHYCSYMRMSLALNNLQRLICH